MTELKRDIESLHEIDGLRDKQENSQEQKAKERQNCIIDGSLLSLKEALALLDLENESEELKGPVRELLEVVKKCGLCENLSPAFLNKINFATLAAVEMLFLDDMQIEIENKNATVDLMTRRYGRDYPPTFHGYLEIEGQAMESSKFSYVFLDLQTLEADMQSLVEAGKKPDMRISAYYGKNPDAESKRKAHNRKLPFAILEDSAKLSGISKSGISKMFVVSKMLENYAESEKLNDEIESFMRHPLFQGIIVMSLKLTDKVGVMQIIEGNNIRLRGSIFRRHPLPMQEKMLAMLENGISCMSFEKSSELSDLQKNEAGNSDPADLNRELDDCLDSFVALEKNRSDRYYRRKMEVFVNNQEDEKMLDGHENHYKKFFSVEGRNPDEVLLTRSGVSANDLATCGLKELMPANAKTYYQSGWYYDNVSYLERKHELTENPDDSDIMFINLDSCYPDDPKAFHSEQQKLIGDFIEKAKKNEKNSYALVVDVTSDLLWGDKLEIPKNLILVKTFSLTKHQRGSRNYFYGGVAVWNSKDLRSKMEENMDTLGGRMLTTGIVHCPRLRKKEIAENIEHLNLLTSAFGKGMEMAMADFPEEKKLKLYAYNYYSYVVFPLESSEYPILSKAGEHSGVRWDFGELAEPGDSFGLEKTRVTYVPKAIRSGEVAIRFSFGIKESEDKAFKLGIEVIENWKEFLSRLEQEKKKD